MCNSRVYLAKSALASGLDVEFVKSNLLRLEGVTVVEYGDNIHPKNCDVIIIVGNTGTFNIEEGSINASEGTHKAFNSFIEKKDIDCAFIATGWMKSDKRDVEPNKMILRRVEAHFLDCSADFKDNTYFTVKSLLCGLDTVANIVGSANDWKVVPRHYEPAPEYRMPRIPSPIERAQRRGTSSHAPKHVVKQEFRLLTRPLLRRR